MKLYRCDKCRGEFPLHLLDSKPQAYANLQFTVAMLEEAVDRGLDFDIMQCQPCYGPAWEEGVPE